MENQSAEPTAARAPKHARLLRVSEVLARLGCGTTRFYELAAAGRLQLVKLGASTRVRESDLEEFILSLPLVQKPGSGSGRHAA